MCRKCELLRVSQQIVLKSVPIKLLSTDLSVTHSVVLLLNDISRKIKVKTLKFKNSVRAEKSHRENSKNHFEFESL